MPEDKLPSVVMRALDWLDDHGVLILEPASWPDLRITIRPLPWNWRVGFDHEWTDDTAIDEPTSTFHLYLGPVSLEWLANRPMFIWIKREVSR